MTLPQKDGTELYRYQFDNTLPTEKKKPHIMNKFFVDLLPKLQNELGLEVIKIIVWDDLGLSVYVIATRELTEPEINTVESQLHG